MGASMQMFRLGRRVEDIRKGAAGQISNRSYCKRRPPGKGTKPCRMIWGERNYGAKGKGRLRIYHIFTQIALNTIFFDASSIYLMYFLAKVAMKAAHKRVPNMVSAIATAWYSALSLKPALPGLMIVAIYPGAIAVAKLNFM